MEEVIKGEVAVLLFDKENDCWIVKIEEEVKKYVFKNRKNAYECFKQKEGKR